MTDTTDRPGEQPHAKWLLIEARLKISDLAAWLRERRRGGSREANPAYKSWESIAREIYQLTGVSVTGNGLRVRWTDEVDDQGTGDAGGASQPGPAGAPPVQFSGGHQ